MRFVKDESGQALMMTVVSMAILLGFMALAVDVGVLFRAKRSLQTVADAAATAGALDYYYNVTAASARTAATAAATSNGVTSGTSLGMTTTVTPIAPVTSGAHTGAGVVEVDITQQQHTSLMSYFGFRIINVAVKAVAGQVINQGCIYLMGGGTAFSLQGSAKVYGVNPDTGAIEPACGIYSNSDIKVTGNGNYIDASYVAAAGALTGSGNTNPAPVIQNAPLEQVPKALQITPPTPASFGNCNPPAGYTTRTRRGVTTYTATISGVTLPSRTCYGIGSANPANTILDLTISNATFPAGLTAFDLGTAGGGGTLTLDSNVTGTGVTMDIYTGNFSINSTNNDHLYAPTDGATDTYNGVLLLEPASNTGTINIQWGASSGDFEGIIDAPGATGTMQDQGGSGALVTGLVLGYLNMSTSTLYVKNYGSAIPGSPLSSIALVE
ncbi:MAG: pilus assembly protein TadG-related protein [Terracidiphilus sp.]